MAVAGPRGVARNRCALSTGVSWALATTALDAFAVDDAPGVPRRNWQARDRRDDGSPAPATSMEWERARPIARQSVRAKDCSSRQSNLSGATALPSEEGSNGRHPQRWGCGVDAGNESRRGLR